MARVNVEMRVVISGRLRNLSARTLLGDPLRRFFGDVTEDFRNEARSRAPEHRGKLKRSHVSDVATGPLPLWGEVRVDSDTAIFVHSGTKPHWAPIRALRDWAEDHGINPFALQWSIARKGTRPNPWFEEAVEDAAPGMVRRHLATLERDVKREWGF